MSEPTEADDATDATTDATTRQVPQAPADAVAPDPSPADDADPTPAPQPDDASDETETHDGADDSSEGSVPDKGSDNGSDSDQDSDEGSDSEKAHAAGDNPAAERAGIYATPSEDEQREIDEERARRLDPANRPDNAEIDNSDASLPTVEKWDEEHPVEPTGGSSDPSAAFRDIDPSDEERKQIEEERARRLDPDNRPDNAEVDNTGRTFEDGHFVD